MHAKGPDKRSFGCGLLVACALSATAFAQVRVFIAPEGEQDDAPTSGNTMIQMQPRGTASLAVWVEDATGVAVLFNGYQLIWPWKAEGQDGSAGSVSYVNLADFPPPDAGGNSVLVDKNEPLWVFHNAAGAEFQPTFYNETNEVIFGAIYTFFFGLGIGIGPGSMVPSPGGPNYMAEFQLQASADACGAFELRFNLMPKDPPLAILYNPFGAAFPVDEWQSLTINLPPCGGECQDPCDDGQACTINDACVVDECVGQAVDCSGAGDECNTASCDPAGAAGNCATLTQVDDGTPCGAGGAGMCMGGVCAGAGCPEGEVVFVNPPDGVVDARQPHPVNSLDPMQGIDTITVTAPAGAEDDCWSLCETGNGGLADNAILDVTEDNGTYTITLARSITPGEVTVINYGATGSPPQAFGQFIFHPANANADGASDAMDILAIIDYLNGTDEPPFGEFSSDINHSNLLAPLDILALVDLLNGAGEHVVWNGTQLPECGNCCPGGGCTADPECDDTNECTADTCELKSGQCSNAPVEDGTPCAGGSCMSGECAHGGETCDEDIDCEDGNPCTTDTCNAAGQCESQPLADGTPCGFGGSCAASECAGQVQRRMFMCRDGEQADQPANGNTTMDLTAGQTALVSVFLEDTTAPGATLLHAYQVILHYDATPLAGAAGTVEYVDNNIGSPGDTIFIDIDREDWVFLGASPIPLPIFYNESPKGMPPIFGVFYETLPTLTVDPVGIKYFLELELQASADACGQFAYPFNLAPDPPPLSALFNAFGGPNGAEVDQWQVMTINLPPCE